MTYSLYTGKECFNCNYISIYLYIDEPCTKTYYSEILREKYSGKNYVIWIWIKGANNNPIGVIYCSYLTVQLTKQEMKNQELRN